MASCRKFFRESIAEEISDYSNFPRFMGDVHDSHFSQETLVKVQTTPAGIWDSEKDQVNDSSCIQTLQLDRSDQSTVIWFLLHEIPQQEHQRL